MVPRHSSGKVNPILVAFMIPAVVILAAVIFIVARHHFHAGVEAFNSDAYRKDPVQLQGNHYNLDAQIESQLAWDAGFGRIIAVKPLDNSPRLAVFVPESVASDLSGGQRFHMRIVIKEHGVIQAEELDKY